MGAAAGIFQIARGALYTVGSRVIPLISRAGLTRLPTLGASVTSSSRLGSTATFAAGKSFRTSGTGVFRNRVDGRTTTQSSSSSSTSKRTSLFRTSSDRNADTPNRFVWLIRKIWSGLIALISGLFLFIAFVYNTVWRRWIVTYVVGTIDNFLQFVLNGLTTGSVYLLINMQLQHTKKLIKDQGHSFYTNAINLTYTFVWTVAYYSIKAAQELLILFRFGVIWFFELIIVVLSHLYILIPLYIVLVITELVENSHLDFISGSDMAVVAGQSLALNAGRVGNLSLDFWDATAPLRNVEMINIVQTGEVFCDILCPEDMRSSSETGRRLRETYMGPKYMNLMSQQQEQEEGIIIDPVEVTRRRRILQRTDPTEQSKKTLTLITKLLRTLAFARYLINRLNLATMGFILIILKPFFENLDVFLDPVQKLSDKLICMSSGGIECSFREVTGFIAQAGVDGLTSLIPIIGKQTVDIHIVCPKQRLSHVSGRTCGGRLSDPFPSGAFFVSKKETVAENQRRILEEEKAGEKYLECKQHPVDGSWIEVLDGKVIHKSRVNKCPLSRHTFRDTFSNVKQFNMLGVNSECYTVCLDGVEFESCHNTELGHVRRFLGSCSEETKHIQTEQQARRHLVGLFPNSLFTWASSAPKKPTQTTPNTFVVQDDRLLLTGEITNSEDLYHRIHKDFQDSQGQRFYLPNGFECKITNWVNPSLPEALVNTFCLAMKYWKDTNQGVKLYFDGFFNSFLGKNAVEKYSFKNRNLMNLLGGDPDETEESLHRRTKWYTELSDQKNTLVNSVNSVKKYMRLLQATDKREIPIDRIDDMIDVINYRPSRRVLLETRSETIRGRQLIEVVDSGVCNEEGMIQCPAGECRPVDERDQCAELDLSDPNVGTLKRVTYYIHKASVIEVSPDAMLKDAKDCYQGYRQDTSTIPVTPSNLESGGGDFCAGVIPPIPFRFPSIKVDGVNSLINGGCKGATVNTCQCANFYKTAIFYDSFVFDYTDVDVRLKLINFGIWFHFIWKKSLFEWHPEIQEAWYRFLGNFSRASMPRWVIFFFSDLGVKAISPTWEWICWGVHTGSAMVFIMTVFLLYLFFLASVPLQFWFWNFVRRNIYLKF